MKLSIVVLATNMYFILGIRFIKKFVHHYKGDATVTFHIFTDKDPANYLPSGINYEFNYCTHANWQEGTNSKFSSILTLENKDFDYLYYFDADTDIGKDFDESWMLGDLVGGEHYGNRIWLQDCKGLDRNPIGQSYVPVDTGLPCTYFYGAFFGGKKKSIIEFCKTLREWQRIDQSIGYEPPVNDESYINKFFHLNPPTYTVPSDKFAFIISCKGGIDDLFRTPNFNYEHLLRELAELKDWVFDLRHSNLVKLNILDVTKSNSPGINTMLTDSELTIISATWGGYDCTEAIRARVKGNKLFVRADNNIIGDPTPNVVKHLRITLNYNGNTVEQVIPEGQILSFPKNKFKKLGIFYSDYNSNYPFKKIVEKSLDTVIAAAKDKADIVVCSWDAINTKNDVLTVLSRIRSKGHINLCIQILQCLYTAKSMGDYEYVSFLEHDVLYPVDYFEYDDFKPNEIIVNMNYGGLCPKGWQIKTQDDTPLHQITMKFNEAIEFYEHYLLSQLQKPYDIIGPEDPNKKYVNRWSKNMAIHVNHGQHLTGHYTIYSMNNITQQHPYWGDLADYIHLFNP